MAYRTIPGLQRTAANFQWNLPQNLCPRCAAPGTRVLACVLRILAYIAKQQRHRVSREEAAPPQLA
jgi:hypothetical protein